MPAEKYTAIYNDLNEQFQKQHSVPDIYQVIL